MEVTNSCVEPRNSCAITCEYVREHQSRVQYITVDTSIYVFVLFKHFWYLWCCGVARKHRSPSWQPINSMQGVLHMRTCKEKGLDRFITVDIQNVVTQYASRTVQIAGSNGSASCILNIASIDSFSCLRSSIELQLTLSSTSIELQLTLSSLQFNHFFGIRNFFFIHFQPGLF